MKYYNYYDIYICIYIKIALLYFIIVYGHASPSTHTLMSCGLYVCSRVYIPTALSFKLTSKSIVVE